MLVGFKFWCETNNYNKYQITTINLLHYWIFLSFFKIGNNPMVVKTRLTKTLRDGSLSIDLVLAFGTVLFRLSRFGSSYGKCARDICLCTSRLSFRLFFFSLWRAFSGPSKIPSWIEERISVRDTEEAKSFDLENREFSSREMQTISKASSATSFFRCSRVCFLSPQSFLLLWRSFWLFHC